VRKLAPSYIYPRGKVSPPELGAGVIRRDRLLETIYAQAMSKPLVLMVAPAGYGKTILLTSLHARLLEDGRVVHWYNCDRTDSVPQRLTVFLREISHTTHGLADGDSLGLEAGASIAANAITSSFERDKIQATLILENYHLAQSEETDALIEAILSADSPFLHLIVSSRVKPSFASRKLGLSGQLAEYRVRDLAFTPTELAEVAGALAPNLAVPDLESIWQHTEGWPVAIRLFLIALEKGADGKRLFEEMASRDTDVADYLSEEVMRGQSAELQQFLVASSFLEQFNAFLVEAVLPECNGQAMIELADQSNLFLIKVETDSGWFRYHPIFRQWLLSQFDRLPKERRATMRREAGRWLEEHGFIAEAVDMALLSGDAGQARSLLAQVAPELVSVKGDLATFLQLLGRFPRGMIEEDPTLLYWQAWAMFFSRRYRVAAQLVASLHKTARLEGGVGLDEQLGQKIGLLDTLSATFTDDMAAARRAGSDWLSGPHASDAFDRATVSSAVVLANLAFLDLPAAKKAFEVAQRAIADSTSGYGVAWVCGIGMTMDLVAGEPRLALARLKALGEKWRASPETPSNISSTLALLAAASHYCLGETEEAERYVEGGLKKLAEHGVTETAAFGLAACLRLTTLRNGPGEALALAHTLEANLVKAYAPRLELVLRYERSLLLFRAGRIDDAIEESSMIVDVQPLGERRQDEGDVDLPAVRELRQMVAARVAIADRTWNEALRILTHLINSARHGGRHLRLVHGLILKAAAHYGQSDTLRAVRAFLEAIKIAQERGLIQIFLDDEKICRPLVAAAMAVQEQNEAARTEDLQFLRHLQGRFGLEATGFETGEILAPLEPLTSREQLMVEHLHAGMRNREIAARLSMSEATVKWHLYNLYSKLGVNNRTAAIHRARVLGLVRA
jgi:LuxR family maltose regulon positive regulatory protein